jgi:hypothetical protein
MHTQNGSHKPVGQLLHERAQRVLAPCVYGNTFSRSGSPIMPLGTPRFIARAKGACALSVQICLDTVIHVLNPLRSGNVNWATP